ncbi:MAG: phage antirepressor KilAC domain-containing protein [Coriobacteriaceae bacterium]|nr:phage antirepressor KilAC domain-containing protein [Coriobacteriaceae bacterium]MCI7439029.1 phage antirepressor KilAC domain-containing protein [Coriobacteriaceae bacterium]
MGDIQVFDNGIGGKLRAGSNEQGQLWFAAADVAAALGYSSAKDLTRNLDDDEKGRQIVPTPGGNQELSTITEPGLYHSLNMRRAGSVKDDATRANVKAFQHQVNHEILPAIRRDGGYMVARADETPQETMARALLIAQQTIASRDAKIADQQAVIGELSPKAAFFDAVGDSDGKMSVADLSKALRQAGIGMGQNRLFKWFRDNGYMGKRGIHRNRPTQRAIEQGLFYLHDTTFVRRDGKVFNSFTPMITSKGATVFFRRISGQRQIQIDI